MTVESREGMSESDTIAALASPPGEGAISLIRISGPEAIYVADKIFLGHAAPHEMRSGHQRFGGIWDQGKKIDEVMLVVHRAPRSYTGEHVVEISCHGGVLITGKVLQTVLRHGARMARPGEFTERAFLNGKMDLTQAEAVMDLIRAQSELAMRSAQEQLSGRLGHQVMELRDRVLGVLAHVEAYIDFPEEDIDPETGDALVGRMVDVEKQIQKLLDTAETGRILREGVRTVLAGAPNAGKSSLLNAMVGFDRAIVSEIPGTTRDTIEEWVHFHGLALRLIDTAGLRETEDVVEAEGVHRTRKMLGMADVVLHVVDASQPKPAGFTRETAEHAFLILNKSDIGTHPDWQDDIGKEGVVPVSCVTGEGIDRMGTLMAEAVGMASLGNDGGVTAINTRHRMCLEKALQAMQKAVESMRAQESPEFVAIFIRETLDFVGEVVGKTDTEDLLGEIFSTFCLGK